MRSLIAIVDRNWGIGKDEKQLIFIKEDLKQFQILTHGKTVVCGRKTLEALPSGKPLPGRTTVVLTTDKNYKKDDVVVYNDIDTLVEHLPDDCIVIGGASVYNQLYAYCDRAYITYVDTETDSNKFIHRIDTDFNWKLTNLKGPFVTKLKSGDRLKYYFYTYERKFIYGRGR